MSRKPIPRKILLPKLTKKEKDILTKNIFYSDSLNEIKNQDLIFVFGVTKQIKDCAIFVNKILKKGFKGILVITGGVPKPNNNIKLKKPQADTIFSLLKDKSNLRLVVLERKSVNTYENVVFANKIIKMVSVKKFAMISSNLHSLRAFLTLKKAAPRNSRILRYSYLFADGPNKNKMNSKNWFSDYDFSQEVGSEIKRVKQYGLKGDIDFALAKKLLTKNLLKKF